jgi:hypothetical protein
MIKPVVRFTGEVQYIHGKNNEYYTAKVYAIDHPNLGQGIVYTSVVAKKFPDGSFETRNTIYRPVNDY